MRIFVAAFLALVAFVVVPTIITVAQNAMATSQATENVPDSAQAPEKPKDAHSKPRRYHPSQNTTIAPKGPRRAVERQAAPTRREMSPRLTDPRAPSRFERRERRMERRQRR